MQGLNHIKLKPQSMLASYQAQSQTKSVTQTSTQTAASSLTQQQKTKASKLHSLYKYLYKHILHQIHVRIKMVGQLTINDQELNSHAYANIQNLIQLLLQMDKWQSIQNMLITGMSKMDIPLNDQLFRAMTSITFSHLNALNLYNNAIQSIQSLSTLDAPFLQEIVLSQNKIISLKPLRKLYAPNLASIYIMENYVNDLSVLSQLTSLSMNKDKQVNIMLKKISIDWQTQDCKCQSMAFLVKCPFQNVGHYAKKIMKQNGLRHMLQKIQVGISWT